VVGLAAPYDDRQVDLLEWIPDCGCHRINIDIRSRQYLANHQRAQGVSMLQPAVSLVLIGGNHPLRDSVDVVE